MNERNYKIEKGAFYRINLFKNLLTFVLNRNKEFESRLNNVIILLDNLEFLIDDNSAFYHKLNENRETLSKEDAGKLIRILDCDKSIFNQNKKSTKSMLNHLFTAIDKYLSIENYLELFKEINKKDNSKKQVFLSYAYDDKSYTVGLFYYFLPKNIYLYIDWMHNGKISSGSLLKNKLRTALNKSNQFLFLDTMNSQLSMAGNYIIKQWCAWEIGNYFKANINKEIQKKFYLSIYYQNQFDKRKAKNLMLDDFKQIDGIKNGLIY